MKILFTILIVAMLCGCKNDDAQKIADLEKRLSSLEAKTANQDEQVRKQDLNHSIREGEILTNVLDLKTRFDIVVGKLPIDPTTGLPSFRDNAVDPDTGLPLNEAAIDPATGLPIKNALEIKVVSLKGRVTEQNSSWWRWSFILNVTSDMTGDGVQKDADIQFLDSDGFPVDTHRLYKVKARYGRTNSYSGYALIEVPGAARVKNLKAVFN